jgi:hypothetical protein
VNESLGPASTVSEADRYVLASTALFQIRADTAAGRALDIATGKNASISNQPSTLILKGLLANRELQPDRALGFFAQAKAPPPQNLWVTDRQS